MYVLIWMLSAVLAEPKKKQKSKQKSTWPKENNVAFRWMCCQHSVCWILFFLSNKIDKAVEKALYRKDDFCEIMVAHLEFCEISSFYNGDWWLMNMAIDLNGAIKWQNHKNITHFVSDINSTHANTFDKIK